MKREERSMEYEKGLEEEGGLIEKGKNSGMKLSHQFLSIKYTVLRKKKKRVLLSIQVSYTSKTKDITFLTGE